MVKNMKITLLITAGLLLGIWLKPYTPHLFVSTPSRPTTMTVTPTPTPNSIQVVQAIVKEFAPEGKYVVKQMLDISFCESGWRWDAINYNRNNSVDSGPLQVNSVHTRRYGKKFQTDMIENIRVAHAIWKQSGTNPWVCSKQLGYVR